MVLGLTLRRKQRPSTASSDAAIHASPSLPQLHATELSWPSDLISNDVLRTSRTREEDRPEPFTPKSPSSKRESFYSSMRKDTRPSHESTNGYGVPMKAPRSSIASMYIAQSPFKNLISSKKNSADSIPTIATATARSPLRVKRRQPNIVPTYNIMIVGGARTGKTSLARVLLETSKISPFTTTEQRGSLDAFMAGPLQSTITVQSASVQIDDGHEPITLSIVDTPGLLGNNELDLERELTQILRTLNSKFADTLDEENKVIRQTKGDQHIHLCIYLIAPDSIQSRPVARSSTQKTTIPPVPPLPAPGSEKLSSEAHHPIVNESSNAEEPTKPSSPENAIENSLQVDDSDKTGERTAPVETSSPVETRETLSGPAPTSDPPQAIDAPLANAEATRSNVNSAELPQKPTRSPLRAKLSLSRGLQTVKGIENEVEKEMCLLPGDVMAIKRLSTRVNVLPVVSRADTMTNERLTEVKEVVRRDLRCAGIYPGPAVLGAGVDENEDTAVEDDSDEGEEEEVAPVRQARKVVKIRPTSSGGRTRAPSLRSRSRARAASTNEDLYGARELANAIVGGEGAPGSVRALFPLAVMSPDPVPSGAVRGGGAGANGTTDGSAAAPPPSAFKRQSANYGNVGDHLPALKGKYTRNYRWGSVDVLNPDHCDFLALRTAIFGPQMRILKETTNEVLYERFRTEKLLELKQLARAIETAQ